MPASEKVREALSALGLDDNTLNAVTAVIQKSEVADAALAESQEPKPEVTLAGLDAAIKNLKSTQKSEVAETEEPPAPAADATSEVLSVIAKSTVAAEDTLTALAKDSEERHEAVAKSVVAMAQLNAEVLKSVAALAAKVDAIDARFSEPVPPRAVPSSAAAIPTKAEVEKSATAQVSKRDLVTKLQATLAKSDVAQAVKAEAVGAIAQLESGVTAADVIANHPNLNLG